MSGWEKVPGGRMRGRKEATDQMGDEINARILSEKPSCSFEVELLRIYYKYLFTLCGFAVKRFFFALRLSPDGAADSR
jgi:hypothetical protein